MGDPLLYTFLESQRLLVLATNGGEYPWTTNVFYGVDEEYTFYFVSGDDKLHSDHILADEHVAFSVAWYNPTDHTDRKAVQGYGLCQIAKEKEAIGKGVELHNKYYPEFADRITHEYVYDTSNAGHVRTIRPQFMKFWNDAAYGENGTEEFRF